MRIFLAVLIVGCSLLSGWAQRPPANSPTLRQQPALAPNVIEGIEFSGLLHVPVETVKAIVSSKAGEVYSDEAMRRDFNSLWKTGHFDDIRLKTEKGERGGLVVRFVVTERP